MKILDRITKQGNLPAADVQSDESKNKPKSLEQKHASIPETRTPNIASDLKPSILGFVVPKNTSWREKFDIVSVGDGSDQEYRFVAEIWIKDEHLMAEISKKGSTLETFHHTEANSKLFTRQELAHAILRAKAIVSAWAEADQKAKTGN